MCLGIPMRVESVEGFVARCSAKGVQRQVNLMLLQHEDLTPGDHVVVHVGYAIQKMTAAEAETAWEALDGLVEAGEAD